MQKYRHWISALKNEKHKYQPKNLIGRALKVIIATVTLLHIQYELT